jgi:hypothetical protein
MTNAARTLTPEDIAAIVSALDARENARRKTNEARRKTRVRDGVSVTQEAIAIVARKNRRYGT